MRHLRFRATEEVHGASRAEPLKVPMTLLYDVLVLVKPLLATYLYPVHRFCDVLLVISQDQRNIFELAKHVSLQSQKVGENESPADPRQVHTPKALDSFQVVDDSK